MTKFDVQIEIPRQLLELVHTDKWLVRDHLKPAMRKTVPILVRSFRNHLPDGRASGTRALQSAKARARFPNHMKDQLVSRQISDFYGVLQMVGVSKPTGKTKGAAQVRFDHGDKARKGSGRKHVLWGHFDPTRTRPPAMRRQKYDVRERVRQETKEQVIQVVVDAVSKAIQKKLGK